MIEPPIVRTINAESSAEIELVASRMRDTLIEVLGPERGGNMYTMDWLVDRVKFHLSPTQCVGEVFVSVNPFGDITGHTIVRVESDVDIKFGLFSTFYVEPGSRHFGTASALIREGEKWFCEKGLATARTYTDKDNAPLKRLMEKHGYKVALEKNDMVVLIKELT